MSDTNDTIRATLLKGMLNPWFGLAFCIGFAAGYVTKAAVGA